MMGWDKNAIRIVETLLAKNSLPEDSVAILRSLQEQYDEKGFFTGPQRQLITKLRADNKDCVGDQALAGRLQQDLDDNLLHPRSVDFVRDILASRDRYGKWTPAQREHAEKILRGNTDPSDDEIDHEAVRRNKLTRGGKAW